MVHKSVSMTDAGEVTTYIVKGNDTETFMIESFKMSDNFALNHSINRPHRSTAVKIFCNDTCEWKIVVPAGTFSYEDEVKMQDGGKILDIVKDFLAEFFGISFAW